MNLKAVSIISAVISISGCATNISNMYEGPVLPNSEIAIYSPLNRANLNSPSITTTHIDNKIIKTYFPQGHPFGPYVGMLPGEKTVRITFQNYENVIPAIIAPNLINMTIKNFQGYYDITFKAVKGKFYAPIFNYNLPQDKMMSEVCIAELEQTMSLSETRHPQQYIACSKASIPPTKENIKICQEINAQTWTVKLFEEACQGLTQK
ncbi:hypothetical protein [Chromobacterium sp. Panama]|uniref:hypothetical protein n=1 Tax=Chromobacterium sp. Panama TaxID=2161826 RepID=UPI0011B208D0|nr:hypothetical protein [Chromobacterium sp. Panama]